MQTPLPTQPRFAPNFPAQTTEFDGKRLRKAVVRKTVDYNSSIINQLFARVWQRDHRDQRCIQPDTSYYPQLVSPSHLTHNPSNSVTTKFVRAATNKTRCPINCVAWTPEGRRLVTGASSGEFTLWNGLTFNFETILQAHDAPVRAMVWSHNDTWMVTGDHAGYVKYWQTNMNNVKMFQAHKEALRGLSFCPNDTKFASSSDDGTLRIWDFQQCVEERILRGHGADVLAVDWHPRKAMLVSGSKDGQQPVKFWDPKSGRCLATLRSHKSAATDVRWNRNGNWLLTASRDGLVKLFDVRKASPEVRTFRGHKKGVSSLAWHPIHETLFCSGGSDGAVLFWDVGADAEVGAMENAHDGIVWSLAWHPVGHILCSGSNDHSSKFWTRNSPGDKMQDKYNTNSAAIAVVSENDEPVFRESDRAIPGLEFDAMSPEETKDEVVKSPVVDARLFESDLQIKVPYSKPIAREFQEEWMRPVEHKTPLLATPTTGEQMTAVWRKADGGNDDFQFQQMGISKEAFQMDHRRSFGNERGSELCARNEDPRLRRRGDFRGLTPTDRQMPAVWLRPEGPNPDFRRHQDGFQFQQRDIPEGFQFHQMDHRRSFGDNDLRFQRSNERRSDFPNEDPRLRHRGGRSDNRVVRNERDFRARESNSNKRNWENEDQGVSRKRGRSGRYN